MNKKFSFAVVGGDIRQIHLAEALIKDGHTVRTYALENTPLSLPTVTSYNLHDLTKQPDCVIMPIPLSAGGDILNAPLTKDSYSINYIFDLFTPGQLVIGGKISNALFEKTSLTGIRMYDLLEREEFNAANAISTAEGAIWAAMDKLNTTIHNTKILICGFGRIGKLLAKFLCTFGAHITVSARKPGDLTWIGAYGYTPVHTYSLSGNLSEFDIIFNTIPHMFLTRNLLEQVKKECLLIDLASVPGGIDFDAAKDLGLTALHELSIPGRFAPTTAASDMKHTIYNIINEV